ncbi:DEAD/DEAH box helicase [Corynebacterium sp. HMSC055G02]|uniref:Z1 domain-containing protein n=1 Tax=unclassified Corynebacterium TaxID=2624378 RepID=UPI0008A16121|nr:MULTISPECIES: Z1 domain-containing protein [unclassified Corynebacterium]MBC6829895.1 DEAD/DEAH box helicase [Corynebacterium sp. LK32]OFL72856.1 DEAD/DEAH box helicase [Corynebacterium sp. HMSC077C02]OFN55267.1 DEAD/DEAH box helicase [Corynebacterium sp. HMSC055G02]
MKTQKSQFELYQSTLKPQSLQDAVEVTRQNFVDTVLEDYDNLSDLQVLLYGDVQSGKTSHMLGIIAEALDQQFETVIVLTSPNTRLVDQTYNRVFQSLTGVQVCKADLTNEFLLNQHRTVPMPSIIVMGKIPSVLDNWIEVFRQTKSLQGKPVLIIDDEGDATSQNTKVNNDDVSRINKQLTDLRNLATGCIFMQVTGTPQAILLQGEDSGWAAKKSLYFMPGENYVGGSVFFDEYPNPFTRIFSESAKSEELYLRTAVQTHLVTCSMFALSGKHTCNMISHPSHKTPEHDKYQLAMKKIVEETLSNINEEKIRQELEKCYSQLQETYPDAPAFDEVLKILPTLESSFSYPIINARNETAVGDWEHGYNFITGGNSLGRGLTFDWLQTVFYVRDTKKPHADTLWQHARMFGYKRHLPSMRLFMPAQIAKNFKETHEGNEMIKQQLAQGLDINELRVVLGDKVAPTRANVLDNRIVGNMVGGVNYFAADPVIPNFEELDEKLLGMEKRLGNDCEISTKAASLLTRYFETLDGDLDLATFRVALEEFSERNPHYNVRVVLRLNRKVHFGTGALLSPNDQKLAREEKTRPLLILYRIEGVAETADPEVGSWSRDPIWVPNIKMPEGRQYWLASKKATSSYK